MIDVGNLVSLHGSSESIWLQRDLFHQVLQSWTDQEQELLKSLPLYDVGTLDRTIYMTPENTREDIEGLCQCIQRREGYSLSTTKVIRKGGGC